MSDQLVLEPGESVASRARTDAPPAILLDRVNKWFGALHVLRDVSMSIAHGGGQRGRLGHGGSGHGVILSGGGGG